MELNWSQTLLVFCFLTSVTALVMGILAYVRHDNQDEAARKRHNAAAGSELVAANRSVTTVDNFTSMFAKKDTLLWTFPKLQSDVGGQYVQYTFSVAPQIVLKDVTFTCTGSYTSSGYQGADDVNPIMTVTLFGQEFTDVRPVTNGLSLVGYTKLGDTGTEHTTTFSTDTTLKIHLDGGYPTAVGTSKTGTITLVLDKEYKIQGTSTDAFKVYLNLKTFYAADITGTSSQACSFSNCSQTATPAYYFDAWAITTC